MATRRVIEFGRYVIWRGIMFDRNRLLVAARRLPQSLDGLVIPHRRDLCHGSTRPSRGPTCSGLPTALLTPRTGEGGGRRADRPTVANPPLTSFQRGRGRVPASRGLDRQAHGVSKWRDSDPSRTPRGACHRRAGCAADSSATRAATGAEPTARTPSRRGGDVPESEWRVAAP